MAAQGRTRRFNWTRADDRYRRIFLITAYPGECLLTEPTAGTQPPRYEPPSCPKAAIAAHPDLEGGTVQGVLRLGFLGAARCG
jgi:hypothetical protein